MQTLEIILAVVALIGAGISWYFSQQAKQQSLAIEKVAKQQSRQQKISELLAGARMGIDRSFRIYGRLMCVEKDYKAANPEDVDEEHMSLLKQLTEVTISQRSACKGLLGDLDELDKSLDSSHESLLTAQHMAAEIDRRVAACEDQLVLARKKFPDVIL